MTIQYPELKNPVPSNLHEMIREQCECYFNELIENKEELLDARTEDIFEEDLTEIGKMVLLVHYQEDYTRFLKELMQEAESIKRF